MKLFSVLGSAVLGAGSRFAVLWFSCTLVSAQGPKAVLDRAVDEFAEGRFAQSAATFDEAAKMIPRIDPVTSAESVISGTSRSGGMYGLTFAASASESGGLVIELLMARRLKRRRGTVNCGGGKAEPPAV